MIEELLKYNAEFVENRQYEKYASSKYPNKKIAILACMDTRLTELLPAALGLKNGDAKMIKNAGAIISSPFGSAMRSLIVAIYNLEVEEILIIGHYDCGLQSLDSKSILAKMEARNISKDEINLIKYCGVDLENWLNGFESVEESVKATVSIVVNHPLVPKDINVYGLIMDPTTGKVDKV